MTVEEIEKIKERISQSKNPFKTFGDETKKFIKANKIKKHSLVQFLSVSEDDLDWLDEKVDIEDAKKCCLDNGQYAIYNGFTSKSKLLIINHSNIPFWSIRVVNNKIISLNDEYKAYISPEENLVYFASFGRGADDSIYNDEEYSGKIKFENLKKLVDGDTKTSKMVVEGAGWEFDTYNDKTFNIGCQKFDKSVINKIDKVLNSNKK